MYFRRKASSWNTRYYFQERVSLRWLIWKPKQNKPTSFLKTWEFLFKTSLCSEYSSLDLLVFAREGCSPVKKKFPSGLVTVTAKLYMGNYPSLHMSHSSKGKGFLLHFFTLYFNSELLHLIWSGTEEGKDKIIRVLCSCSEVYYQEQGWHKHLVNTKQAKEAPGCSQEELVGEVNVGGFTGPRTTTAPCHQPGSLLARNHWGAQSPGSREAEKTTAKMGRNVEGKQELRAVHGLLGVGFPSSGPPLHSCPGQDSWHSSWSPQGGRNSSLCPVRVFLE